tara:strand:+ start:2062 stop:2583 length:522 start_codon:yes stop_codon:yes gene_type:complete
MFFYDHAMSRDDFIDQEEKPAGEIDMVDGLRAMSMFKRDSGPLLPTDINQEVKHALVSHPECIVELKMDGFLSESLIRELEQMMKDSTQPMMKMPKMNGSSIIIVTQSPGMQEFGNPNDEIGGPKKKNIPTNPKLYARVKSEAKRKFKVYPSAYANAWLVRTYKKRGGGYRKG